MGEVGAAWASHIPIYGLLSKGEVAGLCRRMILWFKGYRELLEAIDGKTDNE